MRILVYAFLILFVILPVCAQEPTTPTLRSSAVRILDRLDQDSSLLVSARGGLVHWFCRNRRYDEALNQTFTLPNYERIQLTTLITQSAVKANDKDAADKIMSDTLSFFEKHKDDEAWFSHAATFLELALDNNNLTLAAKFVSILEDGSLKKSWALLRLATAHAKSNNQKQGVALAQEALAQTAGFDEDEQSEIVSITVAAAKVMVLAGDIERAKNVANQAVTGLFTQINPDKNDQLNVAAVLAAVGNMSQALGMVESVNERKTPGLISLAQNCADQQTAASLLDRARDLALEPTVDTYAQSQELRDLVSAFLRANRADEAAKLLPRIIDEYQLRTAAIAVSEVLLKARRFVEAEQALDVARKKAEKIVSEKSNDIPGYASSSRVQTKSHILSALVDNYILLGRLDSAELAANAIDHPQYQASALSKIAEAFAAEGEQSKARGFLRRALELSMKSKEYNHDRLKEEALFDISCAMNKAGLHSDFAAAVSRFLEQLEKSELVDQFAAHLFILGDLADSSGITLNSKTVALLKKIEAQSGN